MKQDFICMMHDHKNTPGLLMPLREGNMSYLSDLDNMQLQTYIQLAIYCLLSSEAIRVGYKCRQRQQNLKK